MKKQTLLIAIALIFSVVTKAQLGGILYSSSRVPQMNTQNPAFYPSNNKFYIALPSVSWNFVSPISYNDLLQYDSEKDMTRINLNGLVNNHGDGARTHLDLDAFALGGGFKKGNWFMTFSSQLKTTLDLGLSNGLLKFVSEGNLENTGDNVLHLLDGDLLSAQVYTEYAIGGGYTFFDKLTVAAKAKLIEGYFDLRTNESYVDLYTAEDLSTIHADVFYKIVTASALDDDKEMTMFPKNFGVVFDFGAKYNWNGFEFSASVLDVGKGIHWTDNVKERVPSDGATSFDFTGASFSGVMGNGEFNLDTLSSGYQESIDRLTNYETLDGEDYWTKLPTKMNFGIMYSPVYLLKVGLLYHGEVDHNTASYNELGEIVRTTKLRSSASLMACLNVKDWLEVMLCNSVVSNSRDVDWFNPGVAVNLSLFKTFQIYFAIDYISDIRLVEAKQVKMGLGMNLLFGNQTKKKVETEKK